MGWQGWMPPVPQQGLAGSCTCRAAGSNTAFARKRASISSSVGLPLLAAGCLGFKKSWCFSPVFVAYLLSFPQCSCPYAFLSYLTREVTKVDLCCTKYICSTQSRLAVPSPDFLSLHVVAIWCSKFLWQGTKIEMFLWSGVSKTEQKFWSDEGTSYIHFCLLALVLWQLLPTELPGEMPSWHSCLAVP